MTDADTKESDKKKEKEVTIYVNTRPKQWDKEADINYTQAVALAYDTSTDGPNISYTVDYFKGKDGHKEGSLVQDGPSVPVKEGMVFNVIRTDKS
jgi:hypothetical protein